MILLHKRNGEKFFLNIIHIEKIEEKPDTVITLTNERIYLVKESVEEIFDKITEYNKMVLEKMKQ